MYKIHIPSLPTLNTFEDFCSQSGCKLDPNNELVKLRDYIPWREYEGEYAKNFSSCTRGKGAKSLQIVLGSLVLQTRMNIPDRQFVKALSENPYWQYFIGMKKFETKAPFCSSSLTHFRKRIPIELLLSINEKLLERLEKDQIKLSEKSKKSVKELELSQNGENSGTEILDATCAPSYIAYPKDTSLLNLCRIKLEKIIDYLHGLSKQDKKPRTYRKVIHKDYLSFAKKKNPTGKQIKHMERILINCVKRNLGYVEDMLSAGLVLTGKQTKLYETIKQIYAQQKEMYDNNSHRVENRIVSLEQPYVRPIVRGKSKAPTEFGSKFDVSIDENGYARIEKISFDPYNESQVLEHAVERYKERCGYYPKRILVDQIYRNRKNIEYCKERGIRISGPRLGRPKNKDENENKSLKKIAIQDKKDRLEIERYFSKAKRCSGMGLIKAKLSETTLTKIALSVFVCNLFAVPYGTFFVFYFFDTDIVVKNPIFVAEFYD